MNLLDHLYTYRFELTRIVDGDTFIGVVALGNNVFVRDVKVTLMAVDAPEKTKRERAAGEAVMAYLEAYLKDKPLVIKSLVNPNVNNFGIWLCDLYAMEGDLAVNVGLHLAMLGAAKLTKDGEFTDRELELIVNTLPKLTASLG